MRYGTRPNGIASRDAAKPGLREPGPGSGSRLPVACICGHRAKSARAAGPGTGSRLPHPAGGATSAAGGRAVRLRRQSSCAVAILACALAFALAFSFALPSPALAGDGSAQGSTASAKSTAKKPALTISAAKSGKLALTVGNSKALKAKAAKGAKLTYQSSNKKVATVSKKGKVKAKKTGKATITVTAKKNGVKTVKKVKLTVKPKLTVGAAKSGTLTLTAGNSKALKATATKGAKLTYQSSNKKVATVSKAGKVKALKAGTVTITVTAKKNGVKASKKVKLTVKAPIKPKELNVWSASQMTVGETWKYDWDWGVGVLPTNATNKALAFESSDPSVVSVSAKGKLKAKAEGAATITITAKGNKKLRAQLELAVVPAPIEDQERGTAAQTSATDGPGARIAAAAVALSGCGIEGKTKEAQSWSEVSTAKSTPPSKGERGSWSVWKKVRTQANAISKKKVPNQACCDCAVVLAVKWSGVDDGIDSFYPGVDALYRYLRDSPKWDRVGAEGSYWHVSSDDSAGWGDPGVDLQPGDILVRKKTELAEGHLMAKTGKASHVRIYVGQGAASLKYPDMTLTYYEADHHKTWPHLDTYHAANGDDYVVFRRNATDYDPDSSKYADILPAQRTQYLAIAQETGASEETGA